MGKLRENCFYVELSKLYNLMYDVNENLKKFRSFNENVEVFSYIF